MKWGLTKEKQRGALRFVIKRWNPDLGRPERLPVTEYQHIREKEDELREFVKRLNAPLAAITKVDFKHAFINDELLTEYLEYLQTKITTQSVARTQFGYLKNYVLNYFIGTLDLMNPNDWYAVHQTKWAQYLLNHEVVRAAKTKRDVVIEANRFLEWLADRRGNEIKFKRLEPFTRKRLDSVDAQRKLEGDFHDRKIITDDHWALIEKRLPTAIRAHTHIAYNYGLRRSETLGLKSTDVKKGYLSVERQLWKVKDKFVEAPTKGKMTRKVPHWFATPAAAYHWIESIQQNPMSPWQLTKIWRDYVKGLTDANGKSMGLDYDFHDLRHTFVTKAMRAQSKPRDVQLAAGHKHISVTMQYLHDDRTMEDELFTP
jgi:integrase